MGCCESIETGERDPLLSKDRDAAGNGTSDALGASAAAGAAAPAGGGLFQQGAAPQLASMQDDAAGSSALAAGEGGADGDALAAKQEDARSAAVINETQRALIDLNGDGGDDAEAAEEEAAEAEAAEAAPGAIRVGATDTLVATAVPVAAAAGAQEGAGGGDDDDDEQDLVGVSVPVHAEGALARRLGTSLAAEVRGVAVAEPPAADAAPVVKTLGDVEAGDADPKTTSTTEGVSDAGATETPEDDEEQKDS